MNLDIFNEGEYKNSKKGYGKEYGFLGNDSNQIYYEVVYYFEKGKEYDYDLKTLMFEG